MRIVHCRGWSWTTMPQRPIQRPSTTINESCYIYSISLTIADIKRETGSIHGIIRNHVAWIRYPYDGPISLSMGFFWRLTEAERKVWKQWSFILIILKRRLVAGNETWLHHDDSPESTFQSLEWNDPTLPPPTNFKSSRSAKKVWSTWCGMQRASVS